MLSRFSTYSNIKKAGLILLVLLALLYLLIEAQGGGDFYIYMSAAHDLFSGVNIYEQAYGDGFHYLYSLFFAVVLYPLSFLPFYLVKFCWLLLNVFLLYRSYKLIFSFFNVGVFTPKQKNIFYALVFLFSARFIHENFHTGQVTILILYTCLQGLHWIFYSDKWWWGCLLIALGVNIKLMPVVLLPYLLYRGRFKAFAAIMVFDAALWLVPALFIGPGKNTFLISEWWLRMNPGNEMHVLDTSERSFHSLTTLLSTLFVKNVPDSFALPLRRNIADVSLHTLSLIILCARALLVSATLFFLGTWPFKAAPGKTHQYTEVAYLLAIVPLIFPHQQHYAFLFLVPAAVYIAYCLVLHNGAMARGERLFLLASCLFIYLCCNLKLILGEFNPYYEHYKILTYGALWLLVVLAYTSRKASQITHP